MKQPTKILIVDDSPEDRMVYQRFLKKAYRDPLEVCEAKTAREGLEQYQSFNPDCILLDYHLPDMTGLDFVDQVRKNKSFSWLPIIMLTGQGSDEIDLKAMQKGVVDYLIKGDLKPEILERTIRYAIERQKLLQEAECRNRELLQLHGEKKLILDAASEGILGLDKNNKINFVNLSAKNMLGVNDKDIQAGYLDEFLQSINHVEERAKSISVKNMQSATAMQNSELALYTFERKDGTQLPVEYAVSSLGNEQAEQTGLVIVFQDVIARAQVERDLAYKASYDRLTGLLNRFVFEELLNRALALAKRHHSNVALLFLDLDNFKQINDNYGHQVGDLLLKKVADRLRNVLRTSDVIARMGGDEFVVLLEGDSDPDHAARAADKILDTMREKIMLNEHELYIKVSIGVAIYPIGGDDAQALLKNADAAMYHAKENGRDCFRFYSNKVNEAVLNAMELEKELRQALDTNQYLLNFQPIVDLKTQKSVGIESLLRWHHPTKGLLSPDKFLPKAEEYHLTIDIGKWLIESMCQHYTQWHEQGVINDTIFVSINISSVQLLYEDFIEHMLQVIKTNNIPHKRIELEISEKSFFENVQSTLRSLERLRNFGPSIAIDNYGVGMSSLAQLKSLPVNALKIDASFILGMMDNQNDAAIVKATIEMAHGMQIKVIAQGVETKAQAERLQQYHCDMAQGYYFCPPLSNGELIKYLSD